MNQQTLQDMANKAKPKSKKFRNAMVAFLSGGVMALIGQGILDLYQQWFDMTAKEATTPMLITVILLTIVLTGLGIYDKLGQFCGAGLFIPISGFANSMSSAAIESKSEGLVLGVGSNMFKLAGTVIVHGVVSAYIVGILRYFLHI